MTLKPFYLTGACSPPPHVALHRIGAPYEAVRVNYGLSELAAANPAGAAPALDTEEEWRARRSLALRLGHRAFNRRASSKLLKAGRSRYRP